MDSFYASSAVDPLDPLGNSRPMEPSSEKLSVRQALEALTAPSSEDSPGGWMEQLWLMRFAKKKPSPISRGISGS